MRKLLLLWLILLSFSSFAQTDINNAKKKRYLSTGVFGAIPDVEFTTSIGTKQFDINRYYGSVIYEAGNVVIDPTDAVATSIVRIDHSDTVTPTFSVTGQSPTVHTSGDYVANVLNIIYITITMSGATITNVYVTIQPQI